LPPKRSAPEDVASAPVTARVATCAPPTYSRTIAPSYVAATCVQVPAGSTDGPAAPTSLPAFTCAAGPLPPPRA
jgi:hypothetical protein